MIMINAPSRYRVKKSFIHSFIHSFTQGEKYTKGRSEENLIDFLNEQCGTSRVSGGGLNSGTIEEFAHLVKKFAASSEERPVVVEHLEKAVEGLAGDEAKVKMGGDIS